jgi:ectoine hydroxylase-related dioxygenase (phytanoyl-CoA dioxygenase family)
MTVDVASYCDDLGWVRAEAVLRPAAARSLDRACIELADSLADPGPGDKPHGATRRLTALDERLPETQQVVADLAPVVDQILTDGWWVDEVAWRSPGPGAGQQQLHADDVPRLGPDDPYRCATAIVTLVDVDAGNGATRVVDGSHRRPDLQRLSQTVDHLDGEHHLEGPAGTAWVFCGHLLHAGSQNNSDASRPVLQIVFRASSSAGGPRS